MAEITKLTNKELKTAITANDGKSVGDTKSIKSGDTAVTGLSVRKSILADMPSAFRQLNSLRSGDLNSAPLDISLSEFVKERFGFAPSDNTMQTPDSFYDALGLRGDFTIEKLMTLGEIDEGYRWLVPELFREAVRLGLRKAPIYSSLIRAEEPVSQLSVTMPDIKMSEMDMKKIGEGETIPVGSMTFGTKNVKLNKIGRGFKITDEAVRYTPLNLVNIAFEDAGVLLGQGLTTMAINTLINGDQADGSDSAAVIGVDNTGNGFTYLDILRSWIRMGRIGNLPNAMLSDESAALDILQLAEFKGFAGDSTTQRINVKTPIPQNQDYHVHGSLPVNKIMLLNAASAMVKLNATSLVVDSDRIVNRQLEEFYVTITTGFATLKRDARLIIDKSTAFSSAGFPSWFDVSTYENLTIGS